MGVKTNKFVIINLTNAFSNRFVTINIPHQVKQINIKSMLYHDDTGSYPRTTLALHSSLINEECMSFFNNSGSPFQYLNGTNSIRYVYDNPRTVQGQYMFYMRNLIGAHIAPPATTAQSIFYLQLEFCSECDEM